MSKKVPASEKRKFIRWFLGHYRLKKPGARKLFDYLLSHDQILDNVHFTDKLSPHGRNLIISTVCSETIPFEYRRLSKVTHDVEEACQEIRRNINERIYIILHFRGKLLSHPYLNIREQPVQPVSRTEEEPPLLFKILADIYLEHSLHEQRLSTLEKEIDRSLQTGDKSLFLQLTEERNQILERLNKENPSS